MIQTKKIFLVDAIGAMISALLIGLVIAPYEDFFGVPTPIAYLLCLIAILLSAFSLLSYLFAQNSWKKNLRIIAILNLGYCAFTASVLTLNSEGITFWGWSYFILEMLIIFALSRVEMGIAKSADN
ncbi:hypothetical protein [Ekhidna sp.]|uniref:hypothetical protein n=1 Tax=Ekhidna sp. TaxID=2608089 RepID=UPI003B5AD6B8